MHEIEGTDETQFEFVRNSNVLNGNVFPVGAPSLGVPELKVIFQKIIYDGLIGDAFLRNFTTTFDIPRARIVFTKPR